MIIYHLHGDAIEDEELGTGTPVGDVLLLEDDEFGGGVASDVRCVSGLF